MTQKSTTTSIDDVNQSLYHIRRTARIVLCAQRLMSVLSASLAIIILITVIDYTLRFPLGIRSILFIAGSVALAVVFFRWIWPAVKFKPPLSSVALRLEKLEPSWRGMLTSGLELSTLQSDVPTTRSLASRVVKQTVSLWSHTTKPRAIRLDGLLRSGVVFVGILGVVLTLAIEQPSLSRIGASRTLMPWLGALWPARTDIESLVNATVHPSDSAIPLRAGLIRSNRDNDSTDVYVRWREPGNSQSQRMLLTWQHQTTPVSIGPISLEAQVFERLHNPQVPQIEFRFETHDDKTPWQRISFIDPPAIKSARVVITPPPYIAAVAPESVSISSTQELDLGDGTDDRSIASTSLAGSMVQLTLDLTKPSSFHPDNSLWMQSTFGDLLAQANPTIEIAGTESTQWKIQFELRESMRVPITLVDSYGISSNTDAVFRFPATQDIPAIISLIEPDRDTEVLPTAIIPLIAQGIDDVGLNTVWMTRQHMVPAGEPQASGPGGATQPLDPEPFELATIDATGLRLQELTAELRLEELNVEPGHEIWIQAFATDMLGAWSESAREPSASQIRVFTVLSEEDFLERIQSGLAMARQAVIATDEQQIRAGEMIEQQPPDTMSRREQAMVSDRITRILEQLEHLEQSVQQNQYEDDSLRAILEAAKGMLQRAGQQSEEASKSIDEFLSQQEDPADADTTQLKDQARQSQENVQQELEQLADLLDRGEDTWVQRRKLQNLLRAQQELRQQTEQASQSTTGKQTDELTPDERNELDRIAQAQQELSEQTGETIESMQENLEQLRENDSIAAAGMEEALKQAQQQDTEQLQQQAAEQVEQNQTSRAMSTQQKAEESLEAMLDALDQALDQRDEVLQRLLLSLIESIESLVNRQEQEIQLLGDNALDTRDDSMIRLRTNTLGVQEQAASGGMELSAVASHLGRASDAQARAVVGLRKEPPDTPRAVAAEQDSLERLGEALRVAKELEEEMADRIQDRKQKELREAYEEVLQQQIEIHRNTAPYAGLEALSRRERLDLRRLGDQQQELAQRMTNLRQEIEDISAAAAFEYAHNKLDGLLSDATTALQEAVPAQAEKKQRRVIVLLRGLLAAVEENKSQDEDFRQNAAGGGSGGGAGSQEEPVIPPIAELKLLKQLQQDLYSRTRSLDESPQQPTTEALRELGVTQQDLAEIGLELIEKLEQDPAQAPTPVPQDGDNQ